MEDHLTLISNVVSIASTSKLLEIVVVNMSDCTIGSFWKPIITLSGLISLYFHFVGLYNVLYYRPNPKFYTVLN